MGEQIVEAVVYAAVSASFILIVVWGRPTAMEQRGRNSWIGIRIPSTMASEAAWSAGHQAAWPTIKVACWFGIASGLGAAALALGGVGSGFTVGVWIVGLLITLVLILVGARIADRAAKALADQPE